MAYLFCLKREIPKEFKFFPKDDASRDGYIHMKIKEIFDLLVHFLSIRSVD